MLHCSTLTLFIASLMVSFPVMADDSYTIQRLLITNQDNKILLVKHENGWMTPALRHNTNQSISDGLRSLASEMGIAISQPKLAGVFMFLPEYKKVASFRQYFRTHWHSGELKTPEGLLDIGWFSHEQVNLLMSDPHAKLVGAERVMTLHLINFPEIVWGGAFSLFKVDGKLSFKVDEVFYPM